RRLVVLLLGTRVPIFREARVPAEPRFFDGAPRDLPQTTRVGIDPTAQLRFLPRKLTGERARQPRDRLTLQRRDLPQQPLHRRVLVGVLVPIGAQLGLLVRQLLQRLRQLGILLDRADHRQRLGREPRVAGLRQQAAQGLPVAARLLPRELHIEEAAEHRIPRPSGSPRPRSHATGPRDRRARRRAVARQRDRLLPEALQGGLRVAQVILRVLHLLSEDLREL